MVLTPAADVLDADRLEQLLTRADPRLLAPVVFASEGGAGVDTGADADAGSPLVDLADHVAVRPAYDGADLPRGEIPLRLRLATTERLVEAQRLLPPGLALVVLDGWRSTRFQQVLVDHYGQDSVDGGFVSAADSGEVAPHVSGGAVDLTLLHEGHALALGTDFDEFRDRTFVASLETDEPASVEARLRRVLYHAMLLAGFAPYEHEWWHFSYGDTHWARYYARAEPLFGVAG